MNKNIVTLLDMCKKNYGTAKGCQEYVYNRYKREIEKYAASSDEYEQAVKELAEILKI